MATTLPPAPPAIDATKAPTLEQFEAVLRRHDSATLALEEWCASRGMAAPATITALLIPSNAEETPSEIARTLALKQGETVKLRHVRLSCGNIVLSEAWNWYVPERLSAEMNDVLGRSNVPFGKVIAALNFQRKPLSTIKGPAKNCPPDTISTHRAKLLLPDQRPLALLVECYTAANLEAR